MLATLCVMLWRHDGRHPQCRSHCQMLFVAQTRRYGTPAPGAFRLRDSDNDFLSVNWLECFEKENIDDNIPYVWEELRRHYKTKKSNKWRY